MPAAPDSPQEQLQAAFGAAVRALRLEQGIAQDRLSEMAALHRTYVGSVERGERNISLSNVQRLAAALGVSLSQLFLRVEHELRDSGRESTANVR